MVKEKFDKCSFGIFSEDEVDLKAMSNTRNIKADEEARKHQNSRPIWKRVGSIKQHQNSREKAKEAMWGTPEYEKFEKVRMALDEVVKRIKQEFLGERKE